jgi:hypothetical protein
MTVTLIFAALKEVLIKPFFALFQMFTLLANFFGVMTETLPTGTIPALFTLAVHIPIAAVSAKFTLTRPGAYSGAFFIITFDPGPAFVLFAEPLKNTLTAFFTIYPVIIPGHPFVHTLPHKHIS